MKLLNFKNYHKQLQALLYTLILKQLPKRFKVVHQTTTIHSLKRTKSTDTDCSCAYRVVLWSVMTISAQNPFTRIQAKTLRINFCKRCFKRFNTAVT